MSSADDNYTIHKVSLKRTRQACGPCRYVLLVLSVANMHWEDISDPERLQSEKGSLSRREALLFIMPKTRAALYIWATGVAETYSAVGSFNSCL